MGKKNRIILLLCIITFPALAIAQVTVAGKVIDASNNPLPGVSVRHLNSPAATSTDADGNFSLSLGNNSGSIEFSYLGYGSLTIPVSQINQGFVLKMQQVDS